MHKFLLTVRHDKGAVNIETAASSEAAARDQVMIAEKCPMRAIYRIRAVDEHGFETLSSKPTVRRVIRPPRDNVRTTEIPGYRVSAAKLPTVYEVRVDGRWRRIFTDRAKTMTYIVHDGLSVLVVLPEDLTEDLT